MFNEEQLLSLSTMLVGTSYCELTRLVEENSLISSQQTRENIFEMLFAVRYDIFDNVSLNVLPPDMMSLKIRFECQNGAGTTST